jgi:hypothetical protein
MAETAEGPARPLRIVFSLLHAGYLRHYLEPIALLAERGHSVLVAFEQPDRSPADAPLVRRLGESAPDVTVTYGLERSRFDGWRRIAWIVRGLTDLARYSHPRYAGAHALRRRIRANVVDRIRHTRMEPLSKALATRLAERIAAAEGAAASERHVRRLARLEAAIPASRRHVELLRAWNADAVIASPIVEIASSQVEWIKAGHAAGVPSAVAVASWDNLTNKGLIRVAPDRVLVWNETQRREAAELHGIVPDTVVVTGAQRFDEWFGRDPSTTRAEFAAQVGLAPGPFVLFLGSSPFIAPDEVSFVRRWLAALRSAGSQELRDASVLVRPHPLNARQWQGFEADRVAVWPPAGAQPDEGRSRDEFFDSLAHAAAVVGVNTSALIESGIVGRSVFTVLDPLFAATQGGTLHFRYLLRENGGFVHVAGTLDEHVRQLEAAMRGEAEDAAGTRAFTESFVRPHGLDRPAAPIVADAIEAVAALGRRDPGRDGAETLALRAALAPLAAVSTAAAFAADVGSRVRGRREPALAG